MTIGMVGVLNASSRYPLLIARIDARTVLAGFDPARLAPDTVVDMLRAEYGDTARIVTEPWTAAHR